MITAALLRLADAILSFGTVNDGQHLKRSGSTIVSSLVVEDTDARITGGTKTIFDPAEQGMAQGTTRLVTSGTAYWCYMGIAPRDLTIVTVRGVLTGNGAGAVVAEMAVASSTTAPTGSAISLTKIAATGSVTDMTSGAQKVISGTVSASVPKGTPWWLGFRAAYGGTQPTLTSLGYDNGLGRLCTTAASGALTGAGPWTATPIAFVASNTQQSVHLVATTF